MDEENNITDSENPISVSKIEKEVSIQNVSFKYENSTILNKINFNIPKGKTVALLGSLEVEKLL